MLVKLKRNLSSGKGMFVAGQVIDLKQLGYNDIPYKLKDVLEEVVVPEGLEIKLVDEPKKEEHKQEEKSKRGKNQSKAKEEQGKTLDLNELDMNI